MMRIDLEAVCLQPITAGQPAGMDARYEPEYADVTAEIDKLGIIDQSSAPSWETVIRQGISILTDKSKDLTIACYVAYAMQMLDGALGLRDASRMLHGLCSSFWETAHPLVARLRRRVNSFDWWHERALAALKSGIASQAPIPSEDRTSLTESLKSLDALLGTLMPEVDRLHDLILLAEKVPTLASAPPQQASPPEKTGDLGGNTADPPRKTDEPPASVVATAASPQISQTVPQMSSVTVIDDDLLKLRRLFIDTSTTYAFTSIKATPSDPLPRRILRIAMWSKVSSLPPAENGRTHLPPPDSIRTGALRKLVDAGRYADAASAAEDLFASSIFWLDAQHLLSEALRGMGPDYAAAADAVAYETLCFIRRFPDVEKLSFDDGTPFADIQTLTWLEKLAATGKSDEGSADGAGSSGCTEAVRTARTLFAKGDLASALQVLDDCPCKGFANRLDIMVEEIALISGAGERSVARNLVQTLLADMERHHVDDWDPAKAGTALLSMRQACMMIDDAELAGAVQDRLARIMPAMALGWKDKYNG